jgi:hypothetical protein
MTRRTIATTELLLIFPAALFMAAVFLRNLLPLDDPSNTAQHLVMWYSVRPWTLWALLIGLPFVVLVTGRATLLRSWNADGTLRRAFVAVRGHLAILLVAGATLTAGGVLIIVALHMLAN